MSLITLVIVLLIAGVICWLLKRAPFIDEPFKSFAVYVILAVVVIWILLSLLGPLPDIRIPHR